MPINVHDIEKGTQVALAQFQAQLIDVPADYEIIDATDFEAAGSVLRQVKSRQHELEELRKSMTRPLDQAKRAILDLFVPIENQLGRNETRLKGAVTAFLRIQETARRQLEAELRDKQQREQQAAEEKAAKLRAKGKDEQADELLGRIGAVPIVVADVPKAQGIGVRSIWKAEVTDFHALIAWSAGNDVDAYLNPDMPNLNAHARATRGTMPIPGVRFYEEASVAVRA